MSRILSGCLSVALLSCMAACDPSPTAPDDLVEDYWAAVQSCGDFCAVGAIEILPADDPADAEGIVPALLAPEEGRGAGWLHVELHPVRGARSFGWFSRSSAEGGVVLDDTEITLGIETVGSRWYQRNRFRPLTSGWVILDGEHLCIGSESAAQIARRTPCDVPTHTLRASLEVVAIGPDCEQVAKGRLYLHHNEQTPDWCGSPDDDDDCPWK